MTKRRQRPAETDSDDYENVESDDSYVAPAKPSRKRGAPAGRKPGGKAQKAADKASAATLEDTLPQHGASTHVISAAVPMREALLTWYAGVHATRGMPWRKPYDATLGPSERAQRAYEVWISEIMLQQTQVATVIPYYNRWMTKFPTIADLAASDIETVNALWKGLGYYSRAARLLSGAKKAVDEFGGRLPDNAKDMEAKMPGIGRYSAGAICSIAYNQCVPVLDGNVHRLLSRVLALYAPPKSKASLDILWAGAAAMVEGSEHPGDINQALIELGSTVCKVREPACGACPLRAWCRAYQYEQHSNTNIPRASGNAAGGENNGVPDIEDLCTVCEPLPAQGSATAFPMKAERKKAREELDVVNVVEWRHPTSQDRWFLLVRRPEGGLLAGLHEFPTQDNVVSGLSAADMQAIPYTVLSTLLTAPPQPYVRPAGRRAAGDENAASAGPLRIAEIRPAGDVLHVFSHIKKTYRIQWVLLTGGGPEPPPLACPFQEPAVGGGGGGGEAAKANAGAGTDAGRPVGAKQERRKGAKRQRTAADARQMSVGAAAWTRLEDVADANIGTGVLKVWQKARALWEHDGEP